MTNNSLKSLRYLRILAWLEGFSLLILLFIAVPLKHFFGYPQPVKMMGSVHGALFLLFAVNTLTLGVEIRWSWKTTWKVLLACLIPFGTFYIDRRILKKLDISGRNR